MTTSCFLILKSGTYEFFFKGNIIILKFTTITIQIFKSVKKECKSVDVVIIIPTLKEVKLY